MVGLNHFFHPYIFGTNEHRSVRLYDHQHGKFSYVISNRWFRLCFLAIKKYFSSSAISAHLVIPTYRAPLVQSKGWCFPLLSRLFLSSVLKIVVVGDLPICYSFHDLFYFKSPIVLSRQTR